MLTIQHTDTWFTVLTAAAPSICIGLAIVASLVLFKKPITTLIENVKSVEAGPIKATVQEAVVEQLNVIAPVIPPVGVAKLDSKADSRTSIPSEQANEGQAPLDMRASVVAFFAQYVGSPEDLHIFMAAPDFNRDKQAAMYFLAAFVCEYYYRLIFRSQLEFLRRVAAASGQPVDSSVAREFYADSVANNNTQTFEQWITFLTNATLVVECERRYVEGASCSPFLAFIEREGYPPKLGW